SELADGAGRDRSLLGWGPCFEHAAHPPAQQCGNREPISLPGRPLQLTRGSPRDIWDVFAREKEIRYASRTKILTDYYVKLYEKDVLLKRILDKVPSAKLTREDKELKQRLSDLPE